MVVMASTAPVSGRCKGPLPFTDCSPSRPGTLSRQHAVAACRQPQRTVTCSAHEGGHQQSVSEILRSAAVGLAAAAAIALPMTMLPDQLMPPAEAGLVSREPVKNARSLLRNALPINDRYIREIQNQLEGISESLRIPGSKSLGPIQSAVSRAQGTLNSNKTKIAADFAPERKGDGEAAIAKLDAALKDFQKTIQAGDKQAVPENQQNCLQYVSNIEEAMVKGFPFAVPPEYSGLPQLKGRATLEMKVSFKTPREDGVDGGVMRIVVDGYNAPVTAGNFVDLVARGFYDGMDIQRADGFVVQTGKPPGSAAGFVDDSGKMRTIPFEVMVQGDKAPVYEETLEDNGRFNEQPALPFNAYGTMALARSEFETNSGSSQFFFLLKESELTPTGSNLLDGRFAVFGYVVDNATLLADLQVGDKINYVKVLDGLQNLETSRA